MSTVHTSDLSEQVFCCYINNTQYIQVGKIDIPSTLNLEKVIFPGERFLFEAPVTAKLSIFTDLAGETTLLESCPCSEIQLM